MAFAKKKAASGKGVSFTGSGRGKGIVFTPSKGKAGAGSKGSTAQSKSSGGSNG